MTESTPDARSPAQPSPRGLRLLDLGGLVAGFGLASLLVRTVWPRSVALTGPPAVAFALEYTWLGLAMSGPIILGLDPRRKAAGPRSPAPRPGRPIGEVHVIPRSQLGPPRSPGRPEAGTDYSRAELAWLGIGGYWIALTFLVVPTRATDAPWTLAGLVPIGVILGLMIFLPGRPRREGGVGGPGWTHHVAAGLLWTWPIAWALLVLLSRTV